MCDQSGPSDFKLLFTPDLPNWVAYKLNASNPGPVVLYPGFRYQTYRTMRISCCRYRSPSSPRAICPCMSSVRLDVEVQNSCLVIDEGAGSKPYDVEITMDSYWGAGPTCTDPTNGAFPNGTGSLLQACDRTQSGRLCTSSARATMTPMEAAYLRRWPCRNAGPMSRFELDERRAIRGPACTSTTG